MRRVLQITSCVLVLGALAVVVAENTVGQTGPNPVCPYLRTDNLGFPLNPPFSEYNNTGDGTQLVGPIDVFVQDLPCCGVIDFSPLNNDPPTRPTITQVDPAQWTQELGGYCQPPDTNLSTYTEPAGTPAFLRLINPYANRQCPATVSDVVVTVEDSNGAVRNCIPPTAILPDIGGGSNFSNGTGGNAG